VKAPPGLKTLESRSDFLRVARPFKAGAVRAVSGF